MTISTNNKEALARRFLSVLGHPDGEEVKSESADDIVWSFPASVSISGAARGVDGILQRARIIASYGVEVEILHAVHGFNGIAIILSVRSNGGARSLGAKAAVLQPLHVQ
jgi:hypothetical protein